MIISTAIIVVVCVHWHLAISHTSNLQLHDFVSSSSSFSSSAEAASSPLRSRSATNDQSSSSSSKALPNQPLDVKHIDDGTASNAPYITSPICGGCSRGSYFDTRPCYTILERDHKKSKGKLSLLDAATSLGKTSEACQICNPEQCWRQYTNNTATASTDNTAQQHLSKYWRFDRSSPKFTNPTTVALPSIPTKFRIPPSRFDDITTYFQEKYEYAKAHNTSLDYLVEYNPGLVPIPSDMLPHLPEGATYLLSLRVTPANNCFSTQTYHSLPKDVRTMVYHTSINHLGLALLNANYKIIPGYDVVIELDVPLDLKRSSISKNRGGVHFESADPTFMDYRVFILNKEIYLHANADTVVISKLRLRAKGYIDDNDNEVAHFTGEEDIVKPCDEVSAEAGEEGNWEEPCLLDNTYGGDNLQVTLMRQFNTIWSGGIHGKNYALFGLPNSTHPDSPDSVFAELDIFPHRVQQVLPEEYDQLTRKDVFDMIWKPGARRKRDFKIDRVNMRSVKEVGNATVSEDVVPLPSFFTVDAHEQWFPGANAPFKEAAHGGACCVSFSVEELSVGYFGGQDSIRPASSLLVGIGHTKVTWKPWYGKEDVPQAEKDRVPHTHYVSLFYAFEPTPPFHIRARSGYFCLGHAPLSTQDNELPSGESGISNAHSILTRNRMLQQNNVIFDCPQMSFISSFIEKVGDSSKTIIGYGLNDCTGRLVEVDKREIVRLLFPDPMEMIFET